MNTLLRLLLFIGMTQLNYAQTKPWSTYLSANDDQSLTAFTQPLRTLSKGILISELGPLALAASSIEIIDSIYQWSWDIQENSWDANPYRRHTFPVYDNNHNALIKIEEKWNGNSWTSYLRFTFTYDSDNNLLTSFSEKWNGSEWNSFSQNIYTYDSSSNLLNLLMQSWTGVSWNNTFRFTNTYDSNDNQLSERRETWGGIGIGWKNDYRITYTYGTDNTYLSGLYESWNGSWGNPIRSSYIYDANNNLTNLLSEKQVGSDWVNYTRHTFSYDANSNLLDDNLELWVDSSSNWFNSLFTNYSYDSNNFQESRAYRFWHSNSVSVSEADSAHFYHHSVTGLKESNRSEYILVYPNPSTGLYHLRLDGVAEYRITNLNGKLLINLNVNGSTSIDLTSQPSGIYYLHIVTEEGQLIQKLVKL